MRSKISTLFGICCFGSLCFLLTCNSSAKAGGHLSRQLQDFRTYGLVFPNNEQQGDETDYTAIPANHSRHAIVVPYRDRRYELSIFRQHMSDYFKKVLPAVDFDLWIVEQDDTEPFNRGWLGNVGFLEAIKHSPNIECIILHDVDLLPEIEVGRAVPYDNCTWPIRLANELEHYDWGVPYNTYIGGVIGVSVEHFRQINGLPNLDSGRGRKDDGFYNRLRQNGLLKRERRWDKGIQRSQIMVPARFHGTFRTTSRTRRVNRRGSETPPKLARQPQTIWMEDGISNLTYRQYESNRTVHSEFPEDLKGFASYHHIFIRWEPAKKDL